MRRILPALLLLMAATAAHAAAPPELTGRWTPTGEGARAKLGASINGWKTKPGGDATFEFRPTMVIERQEGRSFFGYVIQPNGNHEKLAGVVRADGSLILSSVSSLWSAAFVGNDIEWCWQPRPPALVGAYCNLTERKR